MLERHLHRIADALDLRVEAADVVEGDVRHLFKHQVGIILRDQHRQRESHRRIDADLIARVDVLLGQRSGATHQRGVATAIRDQQPSVIACLLHRTDGTQRVGVGLFHKHHVFVQQYGPSGFESGRLHGRRDRHDHAAGSGDHFGASMLHALFIGPG